MDQQEELTEIKLRELVVESLFPRLQRYQTFSLQDIQDASGDMWDLRAAAERRVPKNASQEEIQREEKNLKFIRKELRDTAEHLVSGILELNDDYTQESRAAVREKFKSSVLAEQAFIQKVIVAYIDKYRELEPTGEETSEREEILKLARDNVDDVIHRLIRKGYTEKDLSIALMPTFDIAMQVQIDYPDEDKRRERYEHLMQIRRETIDVIDTFVSEDYCENSTTKYAERWTTYLPKLIEIVRSEVTPKKEGDEHLRGTVRR